ncbi:hypothetical protein VTN02DRAFT_6499 [Thermoascus thermophilus]
MGTFERSRESIVSHRSLPPPLVSTHRGPLVISQATKHARCGLVEAMKLLNCIVRVRPALPPHRPLSVTRAEVETGGAVPVAGEWLCALTQQGHLTGRLRTPSIPLMLYDDSRSAASLRAIDCRDTVSSGCALGSPSNRPGYHAAVWPPDHADGRERTRQAGAKKPFLNACCARLVDPT